MAAVGSARQRPRWWRMASGVVLGGAVAGLAVVAALGEMSGADHDGARPVTAGPGALSLPEAVPAERIAFPEAGLPGWTSIAGRWAVEPMPDASDGGRALVQRAVDNAFNVIVAPGGPYTDVDVTVRMKPISGREDASGGIVFRFVDGQYYVVRANALEGNFRLYYYDRGRHQLASARVPPPALGQWHTLRVIAVGDHIQASLDGELRLDHRDHRFRAGQIGLWTKADSITAFDALVVRGVRTGS